MRWPSSSAAAVVLAACVTTSTTYFVRSPQNPTYTLAQAEPVLAQYVRVQCPARAGAQLPDSGNARFVVEVDSSGKATRAQLRASSGDGVLDGVLGTIAAQLVFPPDGDPSASRERQLAVDFRCDADSALVVVAVRPGRAG